MKQLVWSMLAFALAAPRVDASNNNLVNSHFDSSLASWEQPALTGYSRVWSNARGHDAVGAVSVYAHGTNTNQTTILGQCIAVKPGTLYEIGASFRFESGFGTAMEGQLAVGYYASADCTGSNSGGLLLDTSSTGPEQAGLWQKLTYNYPTPDFVHSIRPVVAARIYSLKDAQGYFDDIYVKGGVIGDANADGAVDAADVFYLIGNLFAAGPRLIGPCDVNDSDSVNVADVFYVINYLFAGGPAPI